jgi:trk system potassium uptake protein TrkA
VACKLAQSVFNVPTRIARLRSRDFWRMPRCCRRKFSPSISPCARAGHHRLHPPLIEFPEALQVLDFANGRVCLVAVRAYEGGLLVGKQIKQMRELCHLTWMPGSPPFSAVTSLYFRKATTVEAGDEVFLPPPSISGRCCASFGG